MNVSRDAGTARQQRLADQQLRMMADSEGGDAATAPTAPTAVPLGFQQRNPSPEEMQLYQQMCNVRQQQQQEEERMAGVFDNAAEVQREHWNSLNDGGIGGALEQRDVKLRQLSELDQQQPQQPPKDRRSIFNPNMQQHHVRPAETIVKQPLQQQQEVGQQQQQGQQQRQLQQQSEQHQHPDQQQHFEHQQWQQQWLQQQKQHPYQHHHQAPAATVLPTAPEVIFEKQVNSSRRETSNHRQEEKVFYATGSGGDAAEATRRRRKQEIADEKLAQQLQEKERRKVAPKKTKNGMQPQVSRVNQAPLATPQPEVDQHMYRLQQDVADLKMQIQQRDFDLAAAQEEIKRQKEEE